MTKKKNKRAPDAEVTMPETAPANGQPEQAGSPAAAPASQSEIDALAAALDRAAQIDLNTADAETLAQLPRVGPAMAGRIIERRQDQPFERPEELMEVPGIGEATFEGLADRVAVPAAEEDGQPAKAAVRPVVEEVPAEKAAAAPASKPAPARDWNGLMGMSLLGALLGAVLTLLILAGINGGTLALNQQAEVTALTVQTTDLTTQVTDLESASRSLRTRLDALDGLTGRVDGLATALDGMDENLNALNGDVADLNERADALAQEAEALRATADRFDAFLRGLSDLLAELPESGSPAATPTARP